MDSYKKSSILFLIFVLIFEIVLAFAFETDSREGWNDEAKFHKTIIQFAQKSDLETLKNYEQMSPPLPFIIFGLWGKLFGLSLFKLRILNIIIAVFTYLIFHRILFILFQNKKIVFLSALYLVIHPYMAGLSMFVYTDMTAIMFLLLSLLFLIEKRIIFFTIALSCAILTRQYFIFFTIGAGIFYFLNFIIHKNNDAVKYLSGLTISCLPYLALVIFWGGLTPDNQWRNYFIGNGLSYKIEFLSHYICLIFLYLIPFYIFKFKSFYNNKIILIISLLLSPVYFLYPVTYEYSQILGVNTVGLFDRALQYLFRDNFIIQSVYYCLFLLALPIVIKIVVETFQKIRKDKIDAILFLNLIILSFLIVMPFSYIGWEKYFIPLVPFLILRILSWEKPIKSVKPS